MGIRVQSATLMSNPLTQSTRSYLTREEQTGHHITSSFCDHLYFDAPFHSATTHDE